MGRKKSIPHECNTDPAEPIVAIVFQVPESVRDRFREVAQDEGEPQAVVLRRLLMRYLGAALLLLTLVIPAGCSAVLPVNLVYPQDGDRELVERAGEILGVPIEFRDKEYGAVTLALADELGPNLDGWGEIGGWRDRECNYVAFAERNVLTIAHELGHTMGLRHTESGLMIHNATESELTDEQLDTIERSAELLYACNPAGL